VPQLDLRLCEFGFCQFFSMCLVFNVVQALSVSYAPFKSLNRFNIEQYTSVCIKLCYFNVPTRRRSMTLRSARSSQASRRYV